MPKAIEKKVGLTEGRGFTMIGHAELVAPDHTSPTVSWLIPELFLIFHTCLFTSC
jgi:hypothetical protein